MSGNLSFLFDRPIIWMTVKYIDQLDNISWRVLGFKKCAHHWFACYDPKLRC